jgi:glycerol-3-phosphate acyltransferase PlsY
MPPIALILMVLVPAYLFGSLPGRLLLGRLRGVDIRTMGSGNAGGSNAFRTRGFAFGAAVARFDLAKGGMVAWLALRYAPKSATWPRLLHRVWRRP